jgi:hypothetical protein
MAARWELVFSLLFASLRGAGNSGVAVLDDHNRSGVCVSTLSSAQQVDALRYLPVFFIGTLMAVRLARFARWTQRRP